MDLSDIVASVVPNPELAFGNLMLNGFTLAVVLANLYNVARLWREVGKLAGKVELLEKSLNNKKESDQ